MSLDDAIEIVNAYFEKRYTSIYLNDAWQVIVEHYKEEKDGIIRTKE